MPDDPSKRPTPESRKGALRRILDEHAEATERESRKEKYDRLLRELEFRREHERAVQAGEALGWLQEKWKSAACPYCDTVEWRVGTPVEIALTDGGALTPHFPVMCANCGNTVLINAVVARIVPEVD